MDSVKHSVIKEVRRENRWYRRAGRRIAYYYGRIQCFKGSHKWRPVKGTMRLDWRSKWEIYQVADGICCREGCDARDEIRRDYYW